MRRTASQNIFSEGAVEVKPSAQQDAGLKFLFVTSVFLSELRVRLYWLFYALTRIPNSFSCCGLTGVGASTIRSTALAVLGNGITSRKLSAPARIITMRSRPSAIPP